MSRVRSPSPAPPSSTTSGAGSCASGFGVVRDHAVKRLALNDSAVGSERQHFHRAFTASIDLTVVDDRHLARRRIPERPDNLKLEYVLRQRAGPVVTQRRLADHGAATRYSLRDR